jgi:hypothetical protein
MDLATQDKRSEITIEDVRRRPWKYVGYRGVSSFIASEDDFFVLRRFSIVTARVLLGLQDEIVELEGKLNDLDESLSRKDAPNIHNGSFRQETSTVRLSVLKRLEPKLRAYNDLVIQHSQLRRRPEVASKDIDSMANWFYNKPKAILDEEAQYIQKTDDLFAMVPKTKSPLRRFLERSSHFRFLRLWRQNIPQADENVHFSSDQRIDAFVAFVLTVLGLAMLISPLWILPYISSSVCRLATITAFVLVFVCFVALIAVSEPVQTLGAAAAYVQACFRLKMLQLIMPK